MPGESLNQQKSVSRPFAIGIGATEILYLLGLIALAAGIILLMGFPIALIVVGAVLLGTAVYNDLMLNKGTQ